MLQGHIKTNSTFKEPTVGHILLSGPFIMFYNRGHTSVRDEGKRGGMKGCFMEFMTFSKACAGGQKVSKQQ